jgi:hypothetical protein
MDVSGRHGELGGRKQRRWAGRKKACLPDHAFIVSAVRLPLAFYHEELNIQE